MIKRSPQKRSSPVRHRVRKATKNVTAPGAPAWGVLGHEGLIEHLKRQIVNGPSSHAFLFISPRGLGVEQCITMLSQAFLCLRPAIGIPCGDCQACALNGRADHPDLILIDNQGERTGIEAIRESIHTLNHRPSLSARRICIINRADSMTEEAANALLKTLEEPSGKSILILSAEHHTKLPATLRSRCSTYFLVPTPAVKLHQELSNQGIPPSVATTLVNIADGRYGYATFLSQQPTLIEDATAIERDFLDLLEAPLHRRITAAEQQADEIAERPEHFFERWESITRKILLASCNVPIHSQHQERIKKIASHSTPMKARQWLDTLLHAKRQLDVSNNARLMLESLFLHLT